LDTKSVFFFRRVLGRKEGNIDVKAPIWVRAQIVENKR